MKLIWIVILLVLFSVIGISDSFGQTEQWSVQFGGSSSDGSHGIVVDSLGNVYVTGTTEGDLFDTPAGESDAFIVKYDTDGNQVWAKQFGSDLRDGGNSVAVDSSGNVYVTGNTSGSLFGIISGKSDAFIVKYDTNGNQVWAKQFGTNSLEEHSGIAVDSSDNVYITGSSTGDNLSGTNIGSNDVFITKYAKNGIKMWAKQFGSISFEGSYGVAVDLSNNVYVTGTAIGDLSGTNMGKMDAFVVKYDSQIFTLQSSLKHQIKNTIPVNDITCKNKNHLLVERTNEKLACVYLNTAEKLDWKSTDSDVIILSQSVKESLLMRYQDMPEVIAFYQKYNDAQVSVRDNHISYFAGSDHDSLMRMNIFFDKNHVLDHVDLHCYFQKAHQFEIS